MNAALGAHMHSSQLMDVLRHAECGSLRGWDSACKGNNPDDTVVMLERFPGPLTSAVPRDRVSCFLHYPPTTLATANDYSKCVPMCTSVIPCMSEDGSAA